MRSRKYPERVVESERTPGAVAKLGLLSRMLDLTGALFRPTGNSSIWESCPSFAIAPGRFPGSNTTSTIAWCTYEEALSSTITLYQNEKANF